MAGPSDATGSEIVFFDLETTDRSQGCIILEFGAILVCPRKLEELRSYSTLVRPSDISLISSLPMQHKGIIPDAMSKAPTFSEIADQVYDILHGRIWAGHNILKFDTPRIRDAFADIGKPAPEPKWIIDSLILLRERFGRRARNNKLATLAEYVGLSPQTHRSLDDVRMNLEVFKRCATILLLESVLPDEMKADESYQQDTAMEEEEEEELCTSLITASLIGTPRIRLQDNGAVQLCCSALRVRWGVIESKYNDCPRRPKLSFVVDASPSLCQILDACDEKAQQSSVESGSSSKWNPIVFGKEYCLPKVRLHIPFIDAARPRFETEIYRKKSYGAVEELKFSLRNMDELSALIKEGTLVDAYLSLDPYDYPQNAAGIRLVAKKLFIHPN